MKNILVPTNFSLQSHHALEVGVQLAARVDGHVVLLHVPDLPAGGGFVTSGSRSADDGRSDVFAIQLLQQVKARMHKLMREAHQYAPNVELEEIVSAGDDVNTIILETIRSHNIDLVVMGTNPAKSSRTWWGGSTTEKVLQQAPCPVLTVKHAHPHFDVQHLVVASNFSEETDHLVPQLRELQELFPNATLHLLDVVAYNARQPEALEHIHSFASRHNFEHYEPDVIVAPRVQEGIPRFAEQAHADLVVMLTHGHTGLSHLWHANTAETVATHASMPVLTLHS